MGTRAGLPHYGVSCLMCPVNYGREFVVAVAHLSREGAEAAYAEHVKQHDERTR